MNWFVSIAAYVVIWWVVIFAILPIGIRPANEGHLGHDAGAPANPRLKLKVLVTSLVAAALWGLLYVAVQHGAMNFRPPV